MGIIETIKMLTREEALEEGMEKGMEKGLVQGEAKKNYEFVSNLLQLNQFSIGEIAKLANVTESFVKSVQVDLKR